MNERAFGHHEIWSAPTLVTWWWPLMLGYLIGPRLKLRVNIICLGPCTTIFKIFWEKMYESCTTASEMHGKSGMFMDQTAFYLTAFPSFCGTFCPLLCTNLFCPPSLTIYSVCSTSPHKASKECHSGFNFL